LKRPEAIDTSANAMPVAAVRPVERLRHIRALDGLRGIAYLLVIGHHCFSTRLPPGTWPFADRILISVFSFGAFGVDLFIVLSGYLITTLLLIDRKGPHYFRNFYVKRAFRILPFSWR
jgi:peptidoglycan/LPS O-acetylase OafA/YrhL